MCPFRRFRIPGSTARVMRESPKKLISNMRRTSASSLSSTAPKYPMPALFTSTSIPPKCCSALFADASTSTGLVTSSSSTSARSPLPFAMSSTFAGSRAVTTARNPRSRNILASSRPKPVEQPVMNQTLSVVDPLVSAGVAMLVWGERSALKLSEARAQPIAGPPTAPGRSSSVAVRKFVAARARGAGGLLASLTMSFAFQIEGTAGAARAGVFSTPHGAVETPAFMPVGTLATVKALDPEDLVRMGASMILSNAYHLHLRPGDDVVREMGGLHRFMQWDGPILTDSGGFQVFSLEGLRTIDEEGVEFQSHIDGSRRFFTPEIVMQIERNLGADVIMQFDHVIPGQADEASARDASERSVRWLARCLAEVARLENANEQALFP